MNQRSSRKVYKSFYCSPWTVWNWLSADSDQFRKKQQKTAQLTQYSLPLATRQTIKEEADILIWQNN